MTSMSMRTTIVLVAAALSMMLLVALAPAGADAATITMVGKKEKDLVFEGPSSIEKGKNLKIVNDTKAQKVGPHTFTLVEKKLLPKTDKETEHCFEPGAICLAVAIAHELDPETGAIGKQDVEAGKKGWDVPFDSVDEDATGDSWYSETLDESTKRKVVAKAGTKLTYFCAVHPWMVGNIKVK